MSPIDNCDGCMGSVVTKQGGSFEITLNVDNDIFKGKNEIDFPVKLRFNKETPGENNAIIPHKFLCNEGIDDCSNQTGTIVYLSHLQFKESLHVIDDTSVPFSGKVSIEGTPYEGSNGCAISNVYVCLVQKREIGVLKTNETLVCGNTKSSGTYSLPVIIGSRIDYIELAYNDHKFEPSPRSEFTPGVTIDAGNYYANNDFVDVQKAHLFVDVVGGLCNKNLGTSTIQVKVVGCDWERQTYPQLSTRGVYDNVPAHLLDVQVMEIENPSKEPPARIGNIWNIFQGDRPLVRTIDLRSAGTADAAIEGERESLGGNYTTGINSKDNIKQEEMENIETIAKEEEENLELVRFQYDGDLMMEVSVLPDLLECSNYSSTEDTDSFHVLDYMKYFLVRIDLKYEIIEDKVYRNIVDSEMKLRVENNVGVDNNTGFDSFYNSISDSQTKEALVKCSDGCLYDIGHAEDNEGNLSSANVTDWFATGRPNIVNQFTKSIIFTIQGGTSDIRHKVEFIIEGYYSKGPGRSFALPKHKTIMVLRDPPGGLSYATYENVMTTMKLETSST